MMKMPSSTTTVTLTILLLITYGSLHWQGVSSLAAVNRQTFWKNLAGTVTATAVVFVTPPLSAEAAFDPQTFNHQYTDPTHPNCKRIVVVKKDGVAAISGTDGKPGCPEDGDGEVWRSVGEVLAGTNNLVVDFSDKGGPAELKGVWDGDGIQWPDGNKWTVKK
mmetsp:Transcript_25401/g.28484  ORF Transcript_25401/g.28484 Transcript_25401/m.28484 type:complete len:163 (-) Transcript_25401:185-673(-)